MQHFILIENSLVLKGVVFSCFFTEFNPPPKKNQLDNNKSTTITTTTKKKHQEKNPNPHLSRHDKSYYRLVLNTYLLQVFLLEDSWNTHKWKSRTADGDFSIHLPK